MNRLFHFTLQIWESSSDTAPISSQSQSSDCELWTTFDSQETVDIAKWSCSFKDKLLTSSEVLEYIGKIETEVHELCILAQKNHIKTSQCKIVYILNSLRQFIAMQTYTK